MFGWKSKETKNVTANGEHRITVKTNLGDVELVNPEDVSVIKIIDVVYIFCKDEIDGIKPIYGIRAKKAEKKAEEKAKEKAEKMKKNLLRAYNKGNPVVTLS